MNSISKTAKLMAGVFLALLVSLSSTEAKQAPDFTLTDASGKSHTLSSYRGKIVVLEWTNFDCPFVKKQYSPGAMQARQESFRDEGVVWLSINSSAAGKQGHFTGKALSARLEKEEFAGSAYLLDADGKVGRLYGAKTTPHMFIVDEKGKLVYEGGIDDERSTKSDDIFISTNYVVESLKARLAGQAIPHPKTAPYGCSVKY